MQRDPPPRSFPQETTVPRTQGERSGGGGSDRRALAEQIAELVDALPISIINVTSGRLRTCRRYAQLRVCNDCSHEFHERRQDGSPITLSCDASGHICPTCGPYRFRADACAADCGLPERVALFRLTACTASQGLVDSGYQKRLTRRLKDYRETLRLRAGSTSRTLKFDDSEGGRLRGSCILAVPTEDALLVRPTRAFEVEALNPRATRGEWHDAQIADHLAALELLKTPAALEGFYLAVRGAQRFRHFGAWYKRRTVSRETGEVLVEGRRNAVGAGSSRQRPASMLVCPRCGSTNLRRGALIAAEEALQAHRPQVDASPRGSP